MSADVAETSLPPADRVVLISGASRGIGLAIARRLASDGYRLSLGMRDPAGFDDGGFDSDRVLRARFDATEPATASAWIEATLGRFGAIDGLVNNAGILRRVTFDDLDETALDGMWEVNAKAPLRLIRLALPHLARCGHGRIVNIGSTDGKRYRDLSVSIGYAMTKHALVALSHAAKFAGWEAGIRTTALLPGAVDTDLIAGIPGVTPGPGRMAPETVAQAVAFVLSLPNEASVAELVMNTRLEPTL